MSEVMEIPRWAMEPSMVLHYRRFFQKKPWSKGQGPVLLATGSEGASPKKSLRLHCSDRRHTV